ncbi:MAG: hypothetical protein GTO41_26865 [Burkholderiales bacterium]|nr:hypothetical protein [Burkholderiales bacterium]
MSDLQIGLLILGLFVIGSVIAFNWYQEKQFRQRAEHGFQRPEADVLLGEAKLPSDTKGDTERERIDPHLKAEPDEVPALEEPEQPIQPQPKRSARAFEASPDPRINYLVEIRAGEVLPASMIQSISAALSETGRKYHILGYDYNTKAWQPVSGDNQWYTSFRVFVQLIDRGGVVTREQLEHIVSLLREQSREAAAMCEAPDIDEAMSKALSLDDFCLETDIIVGLSVAARPGQVLHGTQLRALAESSGLKLDASGVFVMPDGQGGVLFSMDNQESKPFRAEELKDLTTRSVTFLLDVPRTSNGTKVFNKMVAVCKQFADSLDAVLCDDNRSMLNESGLEKIRNQLRAVYEAMEQRGIAAGSETARQLFS